MENREILFKLIQLNKRYGYLLNQNYAILTFKGGNDLFLHYGNINYSNCEINLDILASSIDNSKELSLLKLYAEALERYCLATYDKNRMILSPYLNNKNFVDLSQFINSTHLKLSELKKTDFYWDVVNDFEGKTKYIPSQLIYAPFKEQDIIRLPTSIGTSLWYSKEGCVYNSIMEVIEKDECMRMYLNRENPSRIDNRQINFELKKLTKLAKSRGYNSKIFKINENEEYHTILVILESISNEEMKPKITIGSSSDININVAIKGALKEAIKTNYGNEEMLKVGNYIKNINANNVENFRDRVSFWSLRSSKKHLNFILKTNKKYQIQKLPASINNKKDLEKYNLIINYLSKNNYDYYIKDLSLNEMKNLDIYVFKVIIPKMQPYYKLESFKYDKGKDLKKDINEIPHPFL